VAARAAFYIFVWRTAVRIAILGQETASSMEADIAAALRQLGHDVSVRHPGFVPLHTRIPRRPAAALERLLCDLDLMRSGHPYTRLEGPLLRWLSRERPDALVVVTLPLLSPKVAADLKRALGMRLVGWYPDAVVNLAQHDFVLAPYDLIYLKDPFMVRRFGEFLCDDRVRHLPEAFDGCAPAVDPTPEELEPYRCDVMLWGNLYPYRVRFLQALKGFRVRLYGPRPRARRWLLSEVEHSGIDVRGRQKALASLGAAVCLNPCHFGEVEGANKRLWELAGLGGFQLTNVPAASSYFDPETEVATFSDVADLRQKLTFFLGQPERRSRMAAAARAKALANHTWVHRARVVVQDLARLDKT
jgi:spore maturation protein CgeB